MLTKRGFDWRPPSKLVWQVLFALSEKPLNRTDLAKEVKKPASRISEALSNGASQIIHEDAGKLLRIDSVLKAELQNAKLKYPSLELSVELAGSKAKVLGELYAGFYSVSDLSWATGLSEITVKRILSRFQKILWVFQEKKGKYKIRREENNFPKICSYLKNAEFSKSNLNAGIRAVHASVGKYATPSSKYVYGKVVLCKNMEFKANAFELTGLSVFHKYGVSFISQEIECASQEKQLEKEDILVHAITLNKRDNRALAFCMLFLTINRINTKKALKLSRYFKCVATLKKMLELANSEKIDGKKAFNINYVVE